MRVAMLLFALALPAAAQTIDAPLGGDPPARIAPADTPAGRVATAFYDAFCAHDVATLERLYAPDLRFRDEIFRFDDRAGAMGMWRVLLGPANAPRVTYELLSVEGDVATARWVADYRLFGRPVNNIITARLVVRDGKIVEHTDAFSWARWSRQAFPLGSLPTWGPAERAIKHVMRTFLAFQARRAAPAAPPRAGLIDGLRGR